MANANGAKGKVPSKSAAAAQPSECLPGSKLAAGLYIVATPIGNLDDITLRALKILASVDGIACEDTRVTGKLLMLLGIEAPPLIAYHDHNAGKAGGALLARLQAGAAVALVSDAGTPLLSDPGFPLVRDCLAAGVRVYPVPGASALLSALAVSGLPTDRFFFAGFLPARASARRHELRSLVAIPGTLLFYESPRRLAATLADMAMILGARSAAIARELTKLFEEVRRGPLADLATHYDAAGPPKGEVVIAVAGPSAAAPPPADAIDAALREALSAGSLRDAVAAVTRETGLPRRVIYARAVTIAGSGDGGLAGDSPAR